MKVPITCVDPGFYGIHSPGTGFDDARAVVIGMYQEKRLEGREEGEVRIHLESCRCCRQYLEDLEEITALKESKDPILYAVCPSSATLDLYLFNRDRLKPDEVGRIRDHLKECPLCKEELDWLDNLESSSVQEIPQQRRNWSQYLAYAAALFFLALSVYLYRQQSTHPVPDTSLQALAVIKEPAQIDFVSLNSTSLPLSENMQLQYDQAVALLKGKQFAEASRVFEGILSSAPDHSGTIYLLGVCYFHMNQPEKAFELCDRAEKIEPKSGERCVSLIHIALKTGHYDRALMEAAALYHEDPDNPEIRNLYFKITELTRGRSLKL